MLPRSTRLSPTDRRVGIHNITSRPAQASLALRPAGSLDRPRRPLSRGFETASYPTAPLVSYQINRQLSGWFLPPLVVHAFGAHCRVMGNRRAMYISRRIAVKTARCQYHTCGGVLITAPKTEHELVRRMQMRLGNRMPRSGALRVGLRTMIAKQMQNTICLGVRYSFDRENVGSIITCKAALLVEIIVDRCMGRGEFLQCLYVSEPRHRSFSSPERLV